MNLQEVIRIFGGDPCKTQQNVICPAHDDKQASLSIRLSSSQDKILMHCHAGCKIGDVLASKGITMADLYAESQNCNNSRIVAKYKYYDKNSILVATKIRYEPKGFSWEKTDKFERYPMYNQYNCNVINSDTVYIVEGEKDVDTLTKYGIPAICTPHGAKKGSIDNTWPTDYIEYLKGRHVVLIPDNDEVGKEYVQKTASKLYGKVASIKIAYLDKIWDGISDKDDVTDYFDNGGTKEALIKLVDNTAPYCNMPNKSLLSTVTALELYNQYLPPPRFIVQDFIPVGLSMITAQPKTGKSWFALDLCLSVTSGNPFMSHHVNSCGALYLALEDSYSRIKSRLGKIGGHTFPDNFYITNKCSEIRNGFEEELNDFLESHPDVKLVVIDTFQRIRGNCKSNDYAADSADMSVLKSIADARNIAILIVHHNRKLSDPSDPFKEILGTNGIMGIADTIFTVIKDSRKSHKATLNIIGRDIEDATELIEFDKSSCRWRRIGSKDECDREARYQEYASNGIVKTIKYYVELMSLKGWRTKCAEICDAVKIQDPDFYQRQELNAKKVGRALAGIIPFIEEYYGIKTEICKNGNAGNTYLFYKCYS